MKPMILDVGLVIILFVFIFQRDTQTFLVISIENYQHSGAYGLHICHPYEFLLMTDKYFIQVNSLFLVHSVYCINIWNGSSGNKLV
jgi:hypothetical protein